MTDQLNLHTRVGHGEAQSDILGGSTITVIVLFLGAMLVLLMTLMLFLNTAAASHTLSAKLQEAQARAEKTEREAAEARAQLAELGRSLAHWKQKARERGGLISTGLRLWVFPGGSADITDAYPRKDEWHVRYRCTSTDEWVPSAEPGEGDPAVKSYRLGR
ncbi:hypothetical protein HYW17_01635 [Candidatus Uhrbacteria bacterium]|nr:hypothetical protein [Candidatus Uhrbacteria bacterium]